jgi:hypothetical protein
VSYQYIDGGGTAHLSYAYSTSPDGARAGDWHVLPLLSAVNAGEFSSIAAVGGCPAIAYSAGNPVTLNYARADTADGASLSAWHFVRTSPFDNVGTHNSLAVINGNPAISYHCNNTHYIWYVRSTTALGLAAGDWSAPVTIDNSSADLGFETSLTEVAGCPAVAYRDAASGDRVKYARAATATGTTPGDWSHIVTLDLNPAGYPSLALVDGHPAIAYWSSAGNDLMYAWAATATGDGAADWSVFGIDTGPGHAGKQASLAVVGGKPCVASYADGGNGDLLLTRAATASGAQAGDWPAHASAVDAPGDVGAHCSLAQISGRLAISYQDGAPNYDLKYAVLFE